MDTDRRRTPITALFVFLFSFTVAAQTDSLSKKDSGRDKKDQDEKNVRLFNDYRPEGWTASKPEVGELVKKIIQNPSLDRVYYVNGVKTSPDEIKKLKAGRVTAMELLPPEEARKRKIFSEIGEKGVVS